MITLEYFNTDSSLHVTASIPTVAPGGLSTTHHSGFNTHFRIKDTNVEFCTTHNGEFFVCF